MLLWTFGSSLASMPSRALRHLGPSGLLGLPCHLGPLRHLGHLWVSLGFHAILGLCAISDLQVSSGFHATLGLCAISYIRAIPGLCTISGLRTISGLCTIFGPLYHLEPSSHLGPPWHLAPCAIMLGSYATCHLGPSCLLGPPSHLALCAISYPQIHLSQTPYLDDGTSTLKGGYPSPSALPTASSWAVEHLTNTPPSPSAPPTASSWAVEHLTNTPPSPLAVLQHCRWPHPGQ